MNRYLSSGIFIAFLLAGCGTTVGDTLTGSALGAGAGAAIGSTMHETKKGAAAGAGAGALAGFLVHKAGEQLLRDEDLGPVFHLITPGDFKGHRARWFSEQQINSG